MDFHGLIEKPSPDRNCDLMDFTTMPNLPQAFVDFTHHSWQFEGPQIMARHQTIPIPSKRELRQSGLDQRVSTACQHLSQFIPSGNLT